MPEFNLKCISSIRNMAIKSEFLDANLTMLFSSPSRMSGVLSSVLMDNYLHIWSCILVDTFVATRIESSQSSHYPYRWENTQNEVVLWENNLKIYKWTLIHHCKGNKLLDFLVWVIDLLIHSFNRFLQVIPMHKKPELLICSLIHLTGSCKWTNALLLFWPFWKRYEFYLADDTYYSGTETNKDTAHSSKLL